LIFLIIIGSKNKFDTTTTRLVEFLKQKCEEQKKKKIIRIQQQQQRRNNKQSLRNNAPNMNKNDYNISLRYVSDGGNDQSRSVFVKN